MGGIRMPADQAQRLAVALTAVGLMNLAGYILQVPVLSQYARVTSASPLPIVFTDIRGMEPYALDVELIALTEQGQARHYAMDRAWFSQMHGPFVRWHAYLRLISEAPMKSRAMWQSVLRYGFCRTGPLAAEAGIEEPLSGFILRLRSRTSGRPTVWDLPVSCGN